MYLMLVTVYYNGPALIEHLASIKSFKSVQPCEVSSVLVTFQMRNLRQRGDLELSQGPTARKKGSGQQVHSQAPL